MADPEGGGGAQQAPLKLDRLYGGFFSSNFIRMRKNKAQIARENIKTTLYM